MWWRETENNSLNCPPKKEGTGSFLRGTTKCITKKKKGVLFLKKNTNTTNTNNTWLLLKSFHVHGSHSTLSTESVLWFLSAREFKTKTSSNGDGWWKTRRKVCPLSVTAVDMHLLHLHPYKFTLGGSYVSYRVTKCRDKGKQSEWKELVRENWARRNLEEVEFDRTEYGKCTKLEGLRFSGEGGSLTLWILSATLRGRPEIWQHSTSLQS